MTVISLGRHLGNWHETHDDAEIEKIRRILKVGPKGYVHGWHFVGVPLEGDDAHRSVSRPSLNQAEQSSLIAYGSPQGYKTVNPYLHHNGQVFDTSVMKYRDASPIEAGRAENIIKGMDSAFTKAEPLKQPIIVHRGTGDVDAMFGSVGSKIGKTFTSKSYTSTTTVPAAETGFGFGYSSKPGKLVVGIPAGSKVLRGNDFEREIILQRDSRFKVLSDELVGNQRHIRLEHQP